LRTCVRRRENRGVKAGAYQGWLGAVRRSGRMFVWLMKITVNGLERILLEIGRPTWPWDVDISACKAPGTTGSERFASEKLSVSTGVTTECQ
jgi:hypothetical protein